MIVKIQRALNSPGAAALLYDQKRTIQTQIEEKDLPEKIKAALDSHPKVYWHMMVKDDGSLNFRNRAGEQEW